MERAVSALEQAVQLADRVRSLQWRQYFRTWLGEAYRLAGQFDRAREVSRHALEVCTNIGYALGVGFSHQVLGRIAQTEGHLAEAGRHLREALQTLTAIGARFELARTHLDLASLARHQGNREAAGMHLKEAHALFLALRVPQYVTRTEKLAGELRVSLSKGGGP
jgi:tetratricopeptide (TPR) repeat protein